MENKIISINLSDSVLNCKFEFLVIFWQYYDGAVYFDFTWCTSAWGWSDCFEVGKT